MIDPIGITNMGPGAPLEPGWYHWMTWASTPNGAWWPCSVDFFGGFMSNIGAGIVGLIVLSDLRVPQPETFFP